MRRLIKRTIAGSLALCTLGASVLSFQTAVATPYYSAEQEVEYFTAMDMDGNITQIPLDEVPTPDYEQVQDMVKYEYEVSATVNDEQVVISWVLFRS